eukprot:SAG11_NODE_22156_length_411_cov_0.692308_1_plen_68_part_01
MSTTRITNRIFRAPLRVFIEVLNLVHVPGTWVVERVLSCYMDSRTRVKVSSWYLKVHVLNLVLFVPMQ